MLEKSVEKSYKLALLKIEMASNHLWKQKGEMSYLEAAHIKIWKEFMENNKDWRGSTDQLMFTFKRLANLNLDLLGRLKESEAARESNDEDHEVDANNNASGNQPVSPCSLLQNLQFAVSSISSLAGKKDESSSHENVDTIENEREQDIEEQNGSLKGDTRYQEIMMSLDKAIASLNSQMVEEEKCGAGGGVKNRFRSATLDKILAIRKGMQNIENHPCWRTGLQRNGTKAFKEVRDYNSATHNVQCFSLLLDLMTCLNMSSAEAKGLKNTPVKCRSTKENNNKLAGQRDIKMDDAAIIDIISPKTSTTPVSANQGKTLYVASDNDEQLLLKDKDGFPSHTDEKKAVKKVKSLTNCNLFLSAAVDSSKLVENYFAKHRTHVIRLGMNPPVMFPLEKVNTQMSSAETTPLAAQIWIPILWTTERTTETLMYRILNEKMRYLWTIDVTPERKPSKNGAECAHTPLSSPPTGQATDRGGTFLQITEKCQIWDLAPLLESDSPEPESPSKWLAAEDLRFLHNLLESDKKVGLVGSRNPSPADTWSSATDSSPTSSSITTSVDENEVDTDEDVRRKLEWDDDGESNYRNAMKSPRQRKKKRSKKVRGTKWKIGDMKKAFEMAATKTSNLKFLNNAGDSEDEQEVDSFRKLQRDFARRDLVYARNKHFPPTNCLTLEQIERDIPRPVGPSNANNYPINPWARRAQPRKETVDKNFISTANLKEPIKSDHQNAQLKNRNHDEQLKKILNIGTTEEKKEKKVTPRRLSRMSKLKGIKNSKLPKPECSGIKLKKQFGKNRTPEARKEMCREKCDVNGATGNTENEMQAAAKNSTSVGKFFENCRALSVANQLNIVDIARSDLGGRRGEVLEHGPQYQNVVLDEYGPTPAAAGAPLEHVLGHQGRLSGDLQQSMKELNTDQQQRPGFSQDPLSKAAQQHLNEAIGLTQCPEGARVTEHKEVIAHVHQTVPPLMKCVVVDQPKQHEPENKPDEQPINWTPLPCQLFTNGTPLVTATYNPQKCRPPGTVTSWAIRRPDDLNLPCPPQPLPRNPVSYLQNPGNTAKQANWTTEQQQQCSGNVQWPQQHPQPPAAPCNTAAPNSNAFTKDVACQSEVQHAQPVPVTNSTADAQEISTNEAVSVAGVYTQPSNNIPPLMSMTAKYSAANVFPQTNIPSTQIPQMYQVPLARATNTLAMQQQGVNRARTQQLRNGFPPYYQPSLAIPHFYHQPHYSVYQNLGQYVQQPNIPINMPAARLPLISQLLRPQQQQAQGNHICLNQLAGKPFQ